MGQIISYQCLEVVVSSDQWIIMGIDLQFNNVLYTLIVKHATSYECIHAIEWEGKYVMINTFKFCILIITPSRFVT